MVAPPIWHCRCGRQDRSGKMHGMHDHLLIAVYALAGVAVIEAAALGAMWVLVTRTRREAAELRQRVDPRTWCTTPPPQVRGCFCQVREN